MYNKHVIIPKPKHDLEVWVHTQKHTIVHLVLYAMQLTSQQGLSVVSENVSQSIVQTTTSITYFSVTLQF